MKTDVLEHITRDGDRWDLLAWEYYGDATRYEPIIAANPEVMITPILPAGVRLVIPIIEDAELIDSEELPPWKR
ncbi:tail protein X [Geobacter sp.]|uniref:tail protein X n=1 Tax=Geobacter sp. TaxID=46610 RepID=UPI00260FE53F|nr:tail protein X [Geobacter sp.]